MTEEGREFHPKIHFQVADAISNRTISLVYVLGLYRLWKTLTVASRWHIGTIVALCLGAEAIRLRFPRRYRKWRALIATALVIYSQAGPGGWGIYYAMLERTPSSWAWSAAAGVATYVFNPFFFFNRPWQLPLTAHLASSAVLLPVALTRYAAVCDTAVMTTPAARWVTQRIYGTLETAQALAAPGTSAAAAVAASEPALSTRGQCVVLSNTLAVALGFVVPTVILASREAAAFRAHKRRQPGATVPAWRAYLYHTLGSKDGSDRTRLAVLGLLLVHITWICHVAVQKW